MFLSVRKPIAEKLLHSEAKNYEWCDSGVACHGPIFEGCFFNKNHLRGVKWISQTLETKPLISQSFRVGRTHVQQLHTWKAPKLDESKSFRSALFYLQPFFGSNFGCFGSAKTKRVSSSGKTSAEKHGHLACTKWIPQKKTCWFGVGPGCSIKILVIYIGYTSYTRSQKPNTWEYSDVISSGSYVPIRISWFHVCSWCHVSQLCFVGFPLHKSWFWNLKHASENVNQLGFLVPRRMPFVKETLES